MRPKRVLLGLDDSAGAAAAARWAAEAARDSGGEVVVVHAFGARPEVAREMAMSVIDGLGLSDFVTPEGRAELRHLVDTRWCGPLRDAGVPYRTVVSELDAVHAMLEAARHEDVDLIVIGHQGDSGLLHRLFHRMGDRLADHARRPVVVVPAQRATSPAPKAKTE
jgi:nucleotide-binding universal stress UspA family protein